MAPTSNNTMLNSQYSAPYRKLGVPISASETEIRAAYKVLALKLHPDRAEAAQREGSTARFQALSTAYEICLQRLEDPQYSVRSEQDDYDDDDTFWAQDDREHGWWDHVGPQDPEPLKRWAKACAKAQRNSRLPQTELERDLLNVEWRKAVNDYEQWRRQEEAVNPGVEDSGDATRSFAYVEDIDEEWFFDPDDVRDYYDLGLAQLPVGFQYRIADRPPSNAQRRSQISAVKFLDNFERQIRALEARDAAPEELPDEERLRHKRWTAKNREVTRQRLQKAVVREERAVKEAKLQKLLLQFERNPSMIEALIKKGTVNTALFRDVPAAYEQKQLPSKPTLPLGPVPENWFDEMADD
ncbi:hypothetical protein BDV96DRAFT_640844 [Lophiotrema nucula]|uniref:J domain-containing protein n=1 Tax=Lophiotrema nucula TaxID=690887 RepID=A0A6A5ZP63_9PLEO|nr:hypothetical protein BDV96DRAFT_640844 [Lophiotrema nucula]